MAFHTGMAYGVASLTIIVLAWMGARNRRSGWRRQERANDVLDVLIAWAKAKEENRLSYRPVLAPQVNTPMTVANAVTQDLQGQLHALNAALTVNSGIAPAQPPAQPQEPSVPQATVKRA